MHCRCLPLDRAPVETSGVSDHPHNPTHGPDLLLVAAKVDEARLGLKGELKVDIAMHCSETLLKNVSALPSYP
jgi:hypothetical protein